MRKIGRGRPWIIISSKIPMEEAIERGKSKMLLYREITDSGCWRWLGSYMGEGYGTMNFRNQKCRVHRLAYQLWKGPFDPKLDICHTCDNKWCFNPDHLWVGTHRQNMIDHVQKGRHYELKKTHCLRGHPLSGDNIKWMSNGRGRNPARKCVTCDKYRKSAAYIRDRNSIS